MIIRTKTKGAVSDQTLAGYIIYAELHSFGKPSLIPKLAMYSCLVHMIYTIYDYAVLLLISLLLHATCAGRRLYR